MRLFLAVDIPTEIKLFLTQINTEISELPEIKTVNAENMHLTLLFLGEKNIKQIIERVSSTKFESFELKAKRIGFFPDKNHIKIAWLGIEQSKELNALQAQLANALNYKSKQAYVPHLTFARIHVLKSNNRKKLFKILEKYKDKEFKFKVKGYKLYSSELTPLGPIHRVIESFS